jgi:hypothetical protein
MIMGLALFFQTLFWTNRLPVHDLIRWKNTVQRLSKQPVNSVEHLDFIFTSLDHYHSFIQLWAAIFRAGKEGTDRVIEKRKLSKA